MANIKNLSNSLQQWINGVWYGNSWISYLLLPFSGLFAVVIYLRKTMYFSFPKLRIKFRVPTIVVGNITVGGTGKTPMVIYLCTQLKQHGYRPGVSSRGYGVAIKESILVNSSHLANEIGDEPYLIFRNTSCPIVVGPRRKNNISALVNQSGCDVVICDDGLQDYSFVHTFEILMIDGIRRFGNCRLLPAGPLRESLGRISNCDAVVCTAGGDNLGDDEILMNLVGEQLINLRKPEELKLLSDFSSKTVHAVAGIGNPDRFFNQLRSFGINVIEHVFPDHVVYEQDHFGFNGKFPVLMTEKDAVKCINLELEDAWYLPVTAQLQESFLQRIFILLGESNG